jgi:hypothetical protein
MFLTQRFDSITMQNKQLKFPVFFWSRNSMQRITRMTIRVMPTAVHILLSQIYAVNKISIILRSRVDGFHKIYLNFTQ